ncbi:MAG: chorismate-binding protein, partial [Acidobacteriota bacterium]
MQGSHDSRSPHNPEQPLLAQLARLGSSRRGAILATLSPAPAYRLYCDPSDWISADGKPGVVEGLKRIEEARHERELIGWIGYEAGNLFEPAVGQALPSNEQLLEFGVYSGPTDLRQDSPAYIDTPFFVQNLRLDLNRDEYIARVLEILEAIRRGEVYQVNLTMRLRFEFSGDPRSLFSALTRTQPARYGAILKNGEDWILSLSPELFFRTHGRRIVSMPMKGTTERGR